MRALALALCAIGGFVLGCSGGGSNTSSGNGSTSGEPNGGSSSSSGSSGASTSSASSSSSSSSSSGATGSTSSSSGASGTSTSSGSSGGKDCNAIANAYCATCGPCEAGSAPWMAAVNLCKNTPCTDAFLACWSQKCDAQMCACN